MSYLSKISEKIPIYDCHAHFDYRRSDLSNIKPFTILNIILPENKLQQKLLSDFLKECNQNYIFSLYWLPENFVNLPLNKAEDSFNNFFNILRENNNLLVGEVGLDKRYSNYELQKDFFKSAAIFAKNENRLLTVHSVKSNNECIKILKEISAKEVLFHRFSGSLNEADIILNKFGWSISVKINSFSKFIRLINNTNVFKESDEFI